MLPEPEAIRRLFLLRPDVHFLNHGSFGACPRPVFEEYQRLQRELEAEPVEFLHTALDLPRRLSAARARLAAFMGCDRDEMIFVPNATTGLNMVARSLDLRPGDEILTTDQEYGAMDRMWRFLCGKTGARYVPVPLPVPLPDPQEVVERIWSAATDRTRVLFISHVTSSTGIILPVQELIRRARRRGIITILDAAHAPGHIPCHLHTLGCDFASGNWHKWLLAPKGSAFLYARVERQALLEPLIVSWGRQWAEPGPCPFVDEQEWTGTRDPSAWLATPACLDFRKAHAWAEVGARCRRMLRATRRRVLDATGLEPLCEPDPWLAQMATLPLPPGDPDRYQDRLRREFRIQAPVLRFAERNWVRISVQGYTTQEDLDAFVAAVRAFC
ncbi:aminotransferase [bacterium DOLZORAL124_64_63]|nr:MAG: aminotransferase [bacterium DOLZORAL124_64_63]